MSALTQMIHVLERIAVINETVTIPTLAKKGITVVSAGADLGEVVTNLDLSVSNAMLYGCEGVEGFRKRYPGSFTEEDDTYQRLQALKIFEGDPIDGTGDAAATQGTDGFISPTTLVTLLDRPSADHDFVPRAGLIFDVESRTAVVSDGKELVLFRAYPGDLQEISYVPTEPWLRHQGKPLRINRRETYPQHNYDHSFAGYLGYVGVGARTHIEHVPVGGAGRMAMQFLRSLIEPHGEYADAFRKMKAIDVAINCQPDHKTWDLMPTQLACQALGLPEITDIYGRPLTQNEAAPELEDMHYKQGYVLAPHDWLHHAVVFATNEFMACNPTSLLTEKDY